MSTVEQIKAKSDELDQRVVEIKYLRELLDAELRQVCPHNTLLEAPYEQSQFFRDLLPLRGCEDCGLEEEGWNFKTLTGRAYSAKRHEIYRNRRESLARVIHGVIYVGSTPTTVTNDMILNQEPCGEELYSAGGKTCAKLAGHKTYPCEA